MSNTPNCIQHWMLESPNGRLSEGICKKCGESKMFPNLMPWMEEGNSHWTKSQPATYQHKLAVDRAKAKAG